MKNKVCIIVCYFGLLPSTIETFLYSCKNNEEFNWIIFTDNDIKDQPNNVKIVKTNLMHLKEIASKKLNMDINLEKPYKLCDYKVAYGLIFEDYLADYDFWGYGDIDVIYGNLKTFITDEMLDNYDKIYPLGHFSLIRNNEKFKRAFQIETNNSQSYKKVYGTNVACFFDEESGINEKLQAVGGRIYTKFDFADINKTYKRFVNVDKRKLKLTIPAFKYVNELRKNYKDQIFYYKKGCLYQRYVKGNDLFDEQISYIHYRQKLDVLWNENDTVMIISPLGIIGVVSAPDILDIRKYNGIWENEPIVFFKYAYHRIKKRICAETKEKIILIFGKSNLLRRVIYSIKSCFKKRGN